MSSSVTDRNRIINPEKQIINADQRLEKKKIIDFIVRQIELAETQT